MVNQRVYRRFTKEFRQAAVERMKSCSNISALCVELAVGRRLLYRWRQQLEPVGDGDRRVAGEAARAGLGELALNRQVDQLKLALADKALEVDFFQRALHKIAARRRSVGGSGETASTKRFAS